MPLRLVLALLVVLAPCLRGAAQEVGGCAAGYLAAADGRVTETLRGSTPDGAAADYLQLVACAGTAPPKAAAWLRPHVARTLLLVPDSVRARVLREPDARGAAALRPEAGAVLARWWRARDPLPATARNERLDEHLARLAAALPRYPDAAHPTGLDERGRLHLRLGPPPERHTIDFDDGRFLRDVFRFGVGVTLRDFPENELWIYPALGPEAHFLFVHDGTRFRPAGADALVPERLRRAEGSSERALNHAVSALAALRYVYGRLALHHVAYAARYARVEHYALWQENQRYAAEVGLAPPLGRRDAEVGAGRDARQVYVDPTLGIEAPTAFVQEVLTASRHADRQAARRREAAVPREQAPPPEARAEQGRLPVAVRAARFLEADGTTRTEVYWSPPPGALGADANGSRLTLHAVHLDASFRRRHARAARFRLDGLDASDAVLPPRTTVVPGAPAGDRYGVHLQWDQHAPDGRLLRTAVRRLDGLHPLSADPDRLEMSDLRPVFRPAGLPWPADPAALPPYPFEALTPHTPLALVFELYHLAYGPDDRTCARVTYEIERDGRPLAGGTARQTYAGRRARDVVVVDPEAWRGARHVTLRVGAEDCVTGHRAARTLTFGVVLP